MSKLVYNKSTLDRKTRAGSQVIIGTIWPGSVEGKRKVAVFDRGMHAIDRAAIG
jgi:hypothetical protein